SAPLPSSAKGTETWAAGTTIPEISPGPPPIRPTRKAYSPSSRLSIRTAVTATDGASATGSGASIEGGLGDFVFARSRLVRISPTGSASGPAPSFCAAVVVLIQEILAQLNVGNAFGAVATCFDLSQLVPRKILKAAAILT